MEDPIDFDELKRRLGEPELVLLDAMPAKVFERGHLPTARSLPLTEIDGRAHELLDDPLADIVVYCRNEH